MYVSTRPVYPSLPLKVNPRWKRNNPTEPQFNMFLVYSWKKSVYFFFPENHQTGKTWHEMTRTWTCVKTTPHGKGVFRKDYLTLRGALWTPPPKSTDTRMTRNDTHHFMKKSHVEIRRSISRFVLRNTSGSLNWYMCHKKGDTIIQHTLLHPTPFARVLCFSTPHSNFGCLYASVEEANWI